jgi:prevent-host-death family protein
MYILTRFLTILRAIMVTVTIVDAKAHLSDLVDKVEGGEEVVITRHGRPVVHMLAIPKPKKPVPDLSAFRATMPRMRKSSVARLRQMRDESL